MLELRNISKRLRGFELSDVSLTVDRGEYFVLLGPSGVGKTVLLEIIAGLIRPDCGEVLMDGTNITLAAPERRHISVVYQDYALFPHLTVERNIAYGLGARGVDRRDAKRRVADLAELLGISSLLGRQPATLSGGEQQRVALARALAVQPRILLLDEPLSALDTNTRAHLRRELKRMNRELRISFLHVTHDPQEAMTLGDRVGVLLDQRLRQVESPEALFRRPSDPSVAEFLGMRNILPVSGIRGRMCVVNGVEIHANFADSATSHLWIKPEEILLSRGPFTSSARNQFKGNVAGWDHQDSLYAVRVAAGALDLVALVTHTSFKELAIEAGGAIYATFKSSAVYCF